MKIPTTFFLPLLLTVTSLVFLTDVVFAQERGEAIKQRLAELKEARENRLNIGKGEKALASLPMCVGKYKVDDVEDDPHIEKGAEFLLVGPLPVSGRWEITPIGKQKWEFGHYRAFPRWHPDWFTLEPVNVKPHQSESERLHDYLMEVEWGADGCPDYVRIYENGHTGGALSLDPGHAGAGLVGGI